MEKNEISEECELEQNSIQSNKQTTQQIFKDKKTLI